MTLKFCALYVVKFSTNLNSLSPAIGAESIWFCSWRSLYCLYL